MLDINAIATGSKGNAYLIDDGVTKLLLECGIAWKEIQKKLNFRTSEIKGCLVSHNHNDHSKSINDVMKAGIDVYASKGTFETLRINNHRVKPVKAREQFQIGTWTILPFEVEHDVSEPIGFLLANKQGEKVLFATDTYFIRYKFQGLTHVLVECNYSKEILNQNVAAGIIDKGRKKRLMRSHFSLENVKEFLKVNDLSKVQEIWLLHLSDTNSDADLFKREIQELTGKVVFVP
ncbi:MBL fold metallo-hydrolase [Bacillus sp. MRMR6]|uniref:MBL fold metallo-hydrolase n=1 Tax=Bacillus sp. MRMR6 TaxID=1928617 RepID=UPI000951A941|nr:MBL fold metallo-hydrolase [Bacillus sp. MRMR6]OLS39107.1 MBL fold metallo-hydrolase [Bacillus sp. MRMR6]